MPPKKDVPQNLKPFDFHGVELSWGAGSSQARGRCPWPGCQKDGKFFVSLDTGQWDCKSCGASGNASTFLWKLHEESMAGASNYDALAAERGLLDPGTPARWGLCQSVITREWLVPGYSAAGKICQLYRYVAVPGGRRRLMATPPDGETAAYLRSLGTQSEGRGLSTQHGLAGVHLMGRGVTRLYVCEGPWDAMALWEVMAAAKWAGEGPGSGLVPTGSRAASLLAGAGVLGAPGANVWSQKWASLCAGREVCFLYDNDHPAADGKQQGAGLAGTTRATQILARSEGAGPASVSYLKWGPRGHDATLASGFDVRDWLAAKGAGATAPGLKARIARLGALLAKVEPVPPEWTSPGGGGRRGRGDMAILPCSSWAELRASWRRDIKFTDGIDCALSCMLACVTSTPVVGDQLWMKIIGPPSCGKTVLCEALSVNKKFVFPMSTIRGFHSGYKVDREGSEDVSLLAKVRNKTLVTKDGDTLLSSPNLTQILAQARDVYDRVSRSHYNNKTTRTYEGLNMTWLLCGTESLRSLDSSELGERFLDCVVVDDMDDEMEEEIGMRVAYRADADCSLESNGRAEGQHGPARVEAMRLTGGYVEYLRLNGARLLAEVTTPDWAIRRCTRLARFVSYMRARPSSRQGERAQRELSFRLISQHVRLAKCLAVVLNRRAVDDEVMRRVTKVAMDTSRGRSLNLLKALVAAGDEGLTIEAARWHTNETKREETHLVNFLSKIGIIEPFRKARGRAGRGGGGTGPVLWRLTGTMKRLYQDVTATTTETSHANKAP